MTKTQKTDNNKYWKVCEKNWNTYSFLWKNKMLRHFVKVCQFIKQLNIVNIKHLPCDTENPLLDTYPREMKTYIPIKMYTWMFIAALFTIAKKWKQPKCPSTGELVNRMWCIQNMEFYLVIKKMITDTAIKLMNLENIMLNEGNQSQKTTSYYVISSCEIFR